MRPPPPMGVSRIRGGRRCRRFRDRRAQRSVVRQPGERFPAVSRPPRRARSRVSEHPPSGEEGPAPERWRRSGGPPGRDESCPGVRPRRPRSPDRRERASGDDAARREIMRNSPKRGEGEDVRTNARKPAAFSTVGPARSESEATESRYQGRSLASSQLAPISYTREPSSTRIVTYQVPTGPHNHLSTHRTCMIFAGSTPAPRGAPNVVPTGSDPGGRAL